MLYPQNYVVYDFETSSFWSEDKSKRGQITQIGLVVQNQSFETLLEWSDYSQRYDNRILQKSALDFTGTKPSDLDEKGIPIEDIYATLKDIGKQFKEGRYAKPILVGHNSDEFDSKWLKDIFELFNDDYHKYFSKTSYDTMNDARRIWGLEEVKDYKLATVAARLGIEDVDWHNAIADASVTAQIFQIFTQMARGGEVDTSKLTKKEKSRNKFLF